MRKSLVAFRLGATALAALAGVLAPSAAWAGETITYTYDARGRLKIVTRSGTVNNGVTTTYAIDKADNRTSKTTTGSPNSGPP